MTIQTGPWATFSPSRTDPWDSAKVAHLHRRAGFGATWAEIQRDARDGLDRSVRRLLNPPALSNTETQILAGLRRGVLASNDVARLKAWWLYRIVFGNRPLEEKMTLFWHSHFATSNRKVRSIALMLQQNELLRRHALGRFSPLLTAMISDPAMLVWLDGGDSRRARPNENFAREFLELFTIGIGNYTEADIRQAARAFTGWIRVGRRLFNSSASFRFDRTQHDNGEKTFLGQTGRWGAADIVRLTLARPACAEFLCKKLYRFFVNEETNPANEVIRPLAAQFRRRYSMSDVLGVIFRSRHFYAAANRRKRIQGPVDFSAGLLRALQVPRAQVRLLALAAACDRQGQELFHPPNVRGWIGARSWLSSATLLQRTNWANDVVWGNANVGMQSYDPLQWARDNRIAANRATTALMELLVQGNCHRRNRALITQAGRNAGAADLRRALQLIVHVPEFQLG